MQKKAQGDSLHFKRFYTIRVLWILLEGHRKKLPFMFFFMFFQSLISLMGLGLIIPFVSFVFNTSYLDISQDISSFSFPKQWIITISRSIYAFSGLTSTSHLIVLFGVLFIILYGLRLLLGLFLEYKINLFSNTAQNHIFKKMFVSYITMPYIYFLDKNVNQYNYVLSLLSNISGTLRAVLLICNDFIFLFFTSIGIFILFPVLIVFVIGIASVAFVVNKIIRNPIFVTSKMLEQCQYNRNVNIFRGFFQFMFNKLYHFERNIIQKIEETNKTIAKETSRLEAMKVLYKVVIEFFVILVTVVYISYIANNDMLVENAITAFLVLAAALVRIVPAWIRLLGYFASLRSQEINFSVIYNEYIHINERPQQLSTIPEEEHIKQEFNTSIQVLDLEYAYPVHLQDVYKKGKKGKKATKVLKGVSLTIHKGERIGFVGESGGGKTTLCNILMGFLIPSKGNILVDGKNIAETMKSWQENIGYVPQDALLSDDSIIANIAYGEVPENVDRKKIERILRKLLLWNMVKALPEGMDTAIGDFGKKLSGGQKQRMSIARALYRDPSILVFDEATSNLDIETETEVQIAIDKIGKDKTIIIVAHRINTLSKCNRIYSLSKGKIEFTGTYKQLLAFQKKNHEKN